MYRVEPKNPPEDPSKRHNRRLSRTKSTRGVSKCLTWCNKERHYECFLHCSSDVITIGVATIEIV